MSRHRVRLPILPPVGPCRLTRWVAELGAALEPGQLYAELESDKAIMELRAPAACRLSERCVQEGDSVADGVVVAMLELDGPGEAGAETDSGEVESATDVVPTLHYRYLGKPRSQS